MDTIYNLISDGDLTDELATQIRNRSLEQKFLYLDEGASMYYICKNMDSIYDVAHFSIDEIISFGMTELLKKQEKIAFVSLGCGDSFIERGIFQKIKIENRNNIYYVAVDGSKKMLELSIENLINIQMKKKFVCADFSSNVFRRELPQMTEGNTKRMFTFFSNTFGNINHTNIIDILYNLLNTGERIRLDVRIRKGTSAKDDMEAFELYYKYLQVTPIVDSYFYQLKKLHVPFDNGKMIMATSREEAISGLKFLYSFLFTKKTIINIKSNFITILPGEKIDLLQIYSYDPQGLVNFFNQHGFKLVNEKLKDLRGMFLFEKI